jgi:hypothetical protein
MTKSEVESFLGRDWASVQRLKADFWAEQKQRLTPEEILRVGEELWQTARQLHPDWPSPEDRREDLETHIRVSAALRSVV